MKSRWTAVSGNTWCKVKLIVEVKIEDIIAPAVIDTRSPHVEVRSSYTRHGRINNTGQYGLYTWGPIHVSQEKVNVTVLNQPEETVVRLAESLPCLMLLGTDWPYLQKVVAKAMGEISI